MLANATEVGRTHDGKPRRHRDDSAAAAFPAVTFRTAGAEIAIRTEPAHAADPPDHSPAGTGSETLWRPTADGNSACLLAVRRGPGGFQRRDMRGGHFARPIDRCDDR